MPMIAVEVVHPTDRMQFEEVVVGAETPWGQELVVMGRHFPPKTRDHYCWAP